MTDYFALFDEARRPWLDPEELKEKYFARSRLASPSAELNEAFRVLSDPKLRLHHLLTLEGAELTAGRPVPPAVAELFWNTGNLLREIERWLRQQSAATTALARAVLQPERAKLEQRLEKLEAELSKMLEDEIAALRTLPNDSADLVERYDRIAYLSRLRERAAEQRLQLNL
jgi:hypothetical protein